MRNSPQWPQSIPRWLHFVMAADRAGSAAYIGTGFFFAPVLALASHFGLADRGTLEVGQAGDLTVFALDDIDLAPDVRVDDVPGGSWRYTRAPGGYRATAVNGELTFADGAATGARPGSFLQARPRP